MKRIDQLQGLTSGKGSILDGLDLGNIGDV